MAKIFVALLTYIDKIEKEYIAKFGDNMKFVFNSFRDSIKDVNKK